jgi:hypothetical protein
MFPVTNPKVITELKQLAARHGGELPPEVVVDAARSKRSALHSIFPWDDTVAAHQYRLHIARNLLRVVVSYEQVDKEKTIPCRVFVSLTPDRESGAGYRVMHAVLTDAELRRQLLADALAEMKRFALKYRKLDELAGVFAAMDPHLR